MKALNFLIILFVVTTLVSCGGKNGKTHVDETKTFITFEELQAALSGQQVVCGEPGLNCPGYAAKLAFWGEGETDYYLGVCSGTLYNNRYIITNSHCIPHELKSAGSSCSGQIKVLFPRTKDYYKESADCAHIVQVYDQDRDVDMAVIELKNSVYRQNVEFEKNGFKELTSVYAYTSNPTTDFVGTILRKECTLTVDNGYTLTTDASNMQGVLFGSRCEVIGGNSGSGLFNSDGRLIGAINARFISDELQKVLNNGKIINALVAPSGIVQNISCLRSIVTNDGSNCKFRRATNQDTDAFIQRSIVSKFGTSVPESQIEYRLDDGFKLQLTNVGSGKLADYNKSIQSFRVNWFKTLIDHISSSKFKKFLK